MTGWTCPNCGRLFGRSGQSHDYAPGIPLDDWHTANVANPEDVDEALCELLTEAYELVSAE